MKSCPINNYSVSENIKNYYIERISRFSDIERSVQKKINTISNVRLVIAVVTIIASIYSYRQGSPLLFTISLVTGIVTFFLIVLYHENLHSKKVMNQRLKEINIRGEKRITGQWQTQPDQGNEYFDKNHACSSDLDVFGAQSLFQWLSSARTFYGRNKLALYLAEIPSKRETIIKRQEAIRECAPLIDLRQQFEAIASENGMEKDQSQLLSWVNEKPSQLLLSLYYVLKIVPFVFLGTGLLSVALFRLPLIAYGILSFNVVIFGALFFINKKFMDRFEKNGKTMLAYSNLLNLLNHGTFTSAYLKDTQSATSKYSTANNLDKLASIVSSMEIRYSPIGHFVANVSLLWDLRIRVSAERWRSLHGKMIPLWFEQIGQFEAISSFASIAFEHPDWVFPTISDKTPHIKAENAGHPLLPESGKITNSFEYSNSTISIITGSNMSGKSTFLRTVGTNVLLAYAGAPVCAQSMSCSIMHIYTSMRIEDNLSNSISTFYAELLRIKKIIEANSTGIPLLFLLDELFRGTNSEDRHEGAVAVLKRLKNTNTIGIISTHDLQLCKLEDDQIGGFSNYHFKEFYDGKEIRFDYKLNQGSSTTKNALYLLKMLGIT